MPGAYVYMLRCSNSSIYTGWTVDLEKRVAKHNAGKASAYTRSYLPVELYAFTEVEDASAALREEARVKKLSRPEKLALAKTWRQPSEAV